MPRLTLSALLLTIATTALAADGPRLLTEQSVRPQPVKTSSANIRVNVAMTLVPVTVLDQLGHNVTGLSRDNFRVFDGTTQRPIVSFGQQDAPVAVALVFDCSRSMTEKFKTAREAPMELFKRLNPEDESLLVTVADRPELKQGLTSNFSAIRNALVFTHPNGTTSLIDGVFLAMAELKKSPLPRKALVVVSDGGDNDSRYTLNELTSMASEADIQIFSICLFRNPQTPEETAGPELLTKLATVTGGVNYLISDVNDVRTAMGKIGVTLHNEYVIGYYPPDEAPSGKYRKIKVQLLIPRGLPRLQVYARSGYYVPASAN
jgi:Ca-activated chloride channel family protein